MPRTFGCDVLACPRCGGRFRLRGVIEEPRAIRRLLGHLGWPTEVPAARPPHAPPIPFGPVGDGIGDDIAIP